MRPRGSDGLSPAPLTGSQATHSSTIDRIVKESCRSLTVSAGATFPSRGVGSGRHFVSTFTSFRGRRES